MSQQIVISLHENGLPGFAVLTTQKEVQDALQEALDNMSVSMCQRLAEILKEDAVKYFPIIQQGKTYNDGVETIDKTKFDQDLVWIAVYDYIGNGVNLDNEVIFHILIMLCVDVYANRRKNLSCQSSVFVCGYELERL